MATLRGLLDQVTELLQYKGKYKSFGDLHILKGINDTIEKGEKVVIVGPSGSGKSTFLRSLNLLERPTSGTILFEGKDITDPKCDINKHRQKIGMVFQHFNLFPHKTILENMTLAPIKVLKKSKAEAEAQEIEDIPTANKRLSELKQKIKNLGSVNVGAIEEYKEVSERYTFMSEQVEDVEKSKKEIINLIGELTKKMKESFLESFTEINKHFIHTFAELFGGGSAKLELADPEDILNSGIDISVHPPGKIVTHLESLSGGEKALVAIALYFAIMKVRPAPFCVMDEIEAALDEVNVDRFARYMRNLTALATNMKLLHWPNENFMSTGLIARTSPPKCVLAQLSTCWWAK